jgi:hypothetical protein
MYFEKVSAISNDAKKTIRKNLSKKGSEIAIAGYVSQLGILRNLISK